MNKRILTYILLSLVLIEAITISFMIGMISKQNEQLKECVKALDDAEKTIDAANTYIKMLEAHEAPYGE